METTADETSVEAMETAADEPAVPVAQEATDAASSSDTLLSGPSTPTKGAAAEVESPALTPADAKKMTVPLLKAELTTRGLDTSGRKADLLKRLLKDI